MAVTTAKPAVIARRPRTRRLRRRGFDRPRFLWVVVAAFMLLQFAPVIVVAVLSFNSRKSVFVMGGLSLRWYREALGSSTWLAPLSVSIEIAVLTTIVAAVTGTLLALALQRGNRYVARASEGMIILRLVSPETATAFASLLLFTQIGLALSRSTIILGHTALTVPFVAVIVRSRLAGLNPETENSAMDLGATRLQALRLVVLPVIWPSIAVASLLGFTLSFDDFVTSLFTSGGGTPPLPLQIYTSLRIGVTPVVDAIGVLMTFVTILAVGGAIVLSRIARRRTAVRGA
jgi:spermidine/putrescine transport system permease protein